MKFLVIADRPPVEPIKDTLAREDIDAILTLGDLELQEIRYLEMVTDIPKLGVYGNHCSGSYFDPLGITNMHMCSMELNGVTFGGIEGCVRYKNSPTAKMYTQEEVTEMLADFPAVDVMLSHAPPYGVNDEPDDPTHAGYRGLRTYVEQHHPSLLLHGHTYPSEQEQVHRLGSTRIEYVYGSRIITFN